MNINKQTHAQRSIEYEKFPNSSSPLLRSCAVRLKRITNEFGAKRSAKTRTCKEKMGSKVASTSQPNANKHIAVTMRSRRFLNTIAKKCHVKIRRLSTDANTNKCLDQTDAIIQNKRDTLHNFPGKIAKKCCVKMKRVLVCVYNNKLKTCASESDSQTQSTSQQLKLQVGQTAEATLTNRKRHGFAETILSGERSQKPSLIQSPQNEEKSEGELVLQSNMDNGTKTGRAKLHCPLSGMVTKRCRVKIKRVPMCITGNKSNRIDANDIDSISNTQTTSRQLRLQVAKRDKETPTTRKCKDFIETTADKTCPAESQESLTIPCPKTEVKSEYELLVQPNVDSNGTKTVGAKLPDKVTKRCRVKIKRIHVDDNNSITKTQTTSRQLRLPIRRITEGVGTKRKGKDFTETSADIILPEENQKSLRIRSPKTEVKSEYQLILQPSARVNGTKTSGAKLYGHLSVS
uniref:Uncharacterized protein n=1 Tax=Glossina austeni TaxID=7395 RepID=A0A1A9V755_GLOAU